MLKIIEDFPRQWQEGWLLGEKRSFHLPNDLSNIIFLGMGGSATAGDILKTTGEECCPIPLEVNRNYSLPAWVGPQTLALAFSYSGNTRETLTAMEKARSQGARVWSISSGGIMEKNPGERHLKIPGGLPPRGALGYMLAPILAIFNQERFLLTPREEREEVQKELEKIRGENGGAEGAAGPAGLLAEKLKGRIPLILGGDKWGGVAARRWKCQFNENSKTPSFAGSYPEINHNEMAGWEVPPDIKGIFCIIQLQDNLLPAPIKKRMEITGEFFQERGIPVHVIPGQAHSLLARLLSFIYFGDYVSYYLARLYEVDPQPVRVIEDFKKKLETN